MLDTIITSQDYLDDEIVAEKIAAGDFAIQVSPAFEIDGRELRVLLDGHHSLAAAIAAGVEPEIIEQTASDNDAIALLGSDIEGFLAAVHHGADYRFAVTGVFVW